jgi:hypothetical protein
MTAEPDLDRIADELARTWAATSETPLVALLRDRYGLSLSDAMRVIAKAKALRAGRLS